MLRSSTTPPPRLARRLFRRSNSTSANVETLTVTNEESGGESMPWTMNEEKYGPFQQVPDWAFAYSTAPPTACSTYIIDHVEGQVPTDIIGTYYKAGPGNFEREGRRYEHVLDGDGFIASFAFDGTGAVRYRGRFVETEYFTEEVAENKIKYRNVFGTQRAGGFLANAFDLQLKNVANTNVLKWGGRLFALWEAGRPYELNPETLETILYPKQEDGPYKGLGIECSLRGVTIDDGGPVDQLIKVGRSFTAHPHVIDENTMVAFKSTVNAKTNDAVLEFVTYDQNWRETNSVQYSFPDGLAPHDFAVTDDYFLFFENPFGPMDKMLYLLGLKAPTQIMQLLLRTPARLHFVPRHGNVSSFTVEVPPYFNIHMIKAEEKDGKVRLYSNGWNMLDERFFPADQTSVPFLGSWGGLFPDFTNGIVPPSHLYETVVDVTTKQTISHREIVPGLVMEFATPAHHDPNVIYCSVAATDYTSLPGTGLCKINLNAAEKPELWWAESKIFTHEMTPVPKKNGEAGEWLLTLLYDAGNRRTTLAILDSERVASGPMARLHLKHHITYGLHGSFAASSAAQ